MISFDLEKSEEISQELLRESKNHQILNKRINLAGYLKSAVYGGLDGIVTTFSVVVAVLGAGLNSKIVIGMGIANLVGDGISMALGDYLSTKSEMEFYKIELQREKWEIEKYPEGEKQEIFEIFYNKKFKIEDCQKLVEIICKYEQIWIELMMVWELNLLPVNSNPVLNGIVTFLSFSIFGFVPIMPFVIDYITDIGSYWFLDKISLIITIIAMFLLGAISGKFTRHNIYLNGIKTVFLGLIAGLASYLVGYLMSGLVSE